MENENNKKKILQRLLDLKKKLNDDVKKAEETLTSEEEEIRPEFFDDLREEELVYFENNYFQKNTKELDMRNLEFLNGTFFWKCILFSGSVYKPIFNQHLFDPPQISGEPENEIYKKR
jgi:hypothetical protein